MCVTIAVCHYSCVYTCKSVIACACINNNYWKCNNILYLLLSPTGRVSCIYTIVLQTCYVCTINTCYFGFSACMGYTFCNDNTINENNNYYADPPLRHIYHLDMSDHFQQCPQVLVQTQATLVDSKRQCRRNPAPYSGLTCDSINSLDSPWKNKRLSVCMDRWIHFWKMLILMVLA